MKFNAYMCRTIAPLLWNDAEATLSQSERERVDAHLANCPNCARQAKACQQTTDLMRKGRALSLHDPATWQSLRARLESESAPVSRKVPWRAARPIAAGVSAFAAAALIAAGLISTQSNAKRQPLRISRIRLKEKAVSPPARDAKALPPRKDLFSVASPSALRVAPPRQNADSAPVSSRKEKPLAPLQNEMAYLNAGFETSRNADWLPASENAELQAELDHILQTGDDFVTVSFPQIASKDEKGLKAAAQVYKQEKEIVDARLARKVTVAIKGMAFVDFCRQLRAQTGIEITAGRSIANEKLTVFCKEQPMRDLMRQMRQVFGFTWLRNGQEGAFRYDLVQSMRRELEEEELCNRDRAEALLDLNAQVENYRKNLDMSPQEAAAKYDAATGEEKHLLWAHEMSGSGPMQLFLSLSPEELDGLRNGQSLKFSGTPDEKERLLPPGIGERMLNYPDSFRLALTDHGSEFGPPAYVPNGRPLSEFSGLTPTVHLSIQEPEPGHFELIGGAGIRVSGRAADQIDVGDSNTLIAGGLSPSVRDPRNAIVNATQKAAFNRDPALKGKVTLRPAATCNLTAALYEQDKIGPRVTSADALETLYKATGQSIVADYFTRVYEPDAVSVINAPLFDALCRLADAMRMRWKREGGWLQFRSAGYFNENRMEVSNASLNRWAASRREHGALTLSDLIEIAQLTDMQLNSRGMSSGARAVFGLTEWPIARNLRRPDLRFLALLTPQQREVAATEEGLSFTQMSSPQQAAFCEIFMGRFVTAEQVQDASFRVRYLPPASKSAKEKQTQPNLLAPSDTDPDRLILRASAARIGTWKPENEAILQFIYHYMGGHGKRLHDNFGFSQGYNGKIFGD